MLDRLPFVHGELHASLFFFFNDTATTEIYTLSLHDALPISAGRPPAAARAGCSTGCRPSSRPGRFPAAPAGRAAPTARPDRKSTRLNSSHVEISYAVFCLKKKNIKHVFIRTLRSLRTVIT